MTGMLQLKSLFVLGPILALLAVGLFITLRSGVEDWKNGEEWRGLANNLTQVLLRVAGYGVGLLAIQRYLGATW